MVKTLVCLAASMTCGALVLAWLEPTTQDYVTGRASSPNISTAKAMAQRVVASASLPRTSWKAIEVLAMVGPPSALSGALAATTPPEDCHFIVPPSGRLHSVGTWHRQARASGPGGVIRVGVTAAPAAQSIPVAQRLALQALLAELREQTRSATGPVPVRLYGSGADVRQVGEAVHQDLRALLADQSLVG